MPYPLMSLDFQIPNPLPVTLADGSTIEISNLADIEAILAAVAANTASTAAALSSEISTLDNKTKQLLEEISITLKIINLHAESITGNVFAEIDIERK